MGYIIDQLMVTDNVIRWLLRVALNPGPAGLPKIVFWRVIRRRPKLLTVALMHARSVGVRVLAIVPVSPSSCENDRTRREVISGDSALAVWA